MNRLLFGVAVCATIGEGVMLALSFTGTLDPWLFQLEVIVAGTVNIAAGHGAIHVLQMYRPVPVVFRQSPGRTLAVRAALASLVIQLVVFVELVRKQPEVTAYGEASLWSLMMLWSAVIAATMGYGAETSLGRTLSWLLVFPDDVRVPMKWRRRAVRRRRQKRKHRELAE